MQAQVFIVAALVCCAISQVNAFPVRDNGRNLPESYIETEELHLLMILPDGSQRIMTPEEVRSMKSKLRPNSAKMILYKLVDGKDFSRLLTDHQMQRLANDDVMAIVSHNESDLLERPGFGHRMVILEKGGTLKSFMYNLPLQEAVKQLPRNYPYHFSTSKHAYHTNFKTSTQSTLDNYL